MSIDVTKLVAAFGAYYRPDSDAIKTLRSTLYKPSETAAIFQSRPTDSTEWRGTLSSLTRIVQPFQKAFTALGDLKLEPNKFPLFKMKIDLELEPDEIESTYLGFLANLPDNDRKNWPIVRWLAEEHIKQRRDQDLEENEYGKGVYAAPVPNTPGPAGTAMDGILENIRGYGASGRLGMGDGPIITGAPAGDPADWCTQVEEFIRSIPSFIRSKLDKVIMSPENELLYKDGKDAKYNRNYAKDENLVTINKFPNIKVVGLESHAGSNRIWTTIPNNRVNPIKKAAAKDALKVESSKRVVTIFGDWHEALNFEVPEFVFANEQA